MHAEEDERLLTIKERFLIHILNPKATLATLPIATIHFPANQIKGVSIFIFSLVLSMMGAGAPASYALVGQYFSKLLKGHNKIACSTNSWQYYLSMWPSLSYGNMFIL